MKLRTYLKTEKLSQTDFAKQMGVTQGAVWQWMNGYCRVSAENVLPIERATNGKVSRHELRPDLYPREDRVA